MSFYSAMKKVFSGVVRFLWNVRVENPENEPTEGAYLVCANHISAVDPVILAACLGIEPKFMAKKELMKIPLVSGLIKSLGAYPIDRAGNDAGAILKTINYLKDGHSVIMFPQGTRYAGVDPATTNVKSGCAMLALRAGAPVLPVFIKTKDFRSRLFRRTVICVRPPISPEEIESAGEYKDGARMIFERILGKDMLL